MKQLFTAGFVGCGHMGGALATAAMRAVGADAVAVYDPNEQKTASYEQMGATRLCAEDVARRCRFLFLGVKPQVLPQALADIRAGLLDNPDVILVSMAAAVSIASLKDTLLGLGIDRPVIRIMPNTPSAVGQGMTVYAASADTPSDAIDDFCRVLRASGDLLALDEARIDAAGTVAGCGPAFAYMFAEALADGGVACGLSREEAARLSAQMLLGAATMLKTYGHPADLKDAVCSPGGTTIEGVHALEKNGLRAAVMSAVTAAYDKTLRMKK